MVAIAWVFLPGVKLCWNKSIARSMPECYTILDTLEFTDMLGRPVEPGQRVWGDVCEWGAEVGATRQCQTG